MSDFINWLAYDILWGPALIVLMIGAGLYFTLRSGCFQVLHLPYIFKRTLGRLFAGREENEPRGKGLLNPYEAIATAVGGSVGFGNIAGVAAAVTTGGPGAVFWMWLTALLGMIIKQVEVTLAVYYRRTDENGNPYGGPTYYMERGLGQQHHWGRLWLVPALVFGMGIFSTFFISSGNYTASEVIASALHIPHPLAAVLLTLVTYMMIWRGVKKLGQLLAKLVPVASLAYLFFGLVIIVMHIGNLPATLGAIFEQAFTGSAALGGFAGASISKVISTGMARSVYSNEAGWGTSPMVHASSQTRHPVEQGLWGSFEVFVDTFMVCTITALSVLITGQWTGGATNANLVLQVFQSSFGAFGTVLLTAIMFIFTVTTSGGWYAYYEAVLRHLAIRRPRFKALLLKVFRYAYGLPSLALTLYLIYVGDLNIWTLVDITSGIPTFINMVVLLLLSGKYFALLRDYKARHMGIGSTDLSMPLFYEDEAATPAASITQGQ